MPPDQKGARRDRERAQRARALKGETLSAKFLETAFSLKGFGFRDGKTPGSGICRNRSGRPRHKSCLPRRTVLVVLRVPARAPLVFRLWSASLELVVVSRVLSRRPPLRTAKLAASRIHGDTHSRRRRSPHGEYHHRLFPVSVVRDAWVLRPKTQ